MLVSLTKLLQTKSKSQVRKLLKTFKCNLNKDIEFFLINKAILLDAINHTKILRFYCKSGFFPIEKITKQKESIKMFYPLFDK